MAPEANDKRYSYNRFGSKGKRVGQAVTDILSKDQPTYTAGEILDEFAPKFAEEFAKCVEENRHKFDHPFYVFVLSGKEMWAVNMVRNWFIARNTPPYAIDMMVQYPNRTKTLYLVDGRTGAHKILWSLPSLDECKVVLRNKDLYSSELVNWIIQCFEGKLERDKYSFDFEKIA